MSSNAPNTRPAKYKLAPPRRSAALTRGVNKLKTFNPKINNQQNIKRHDRHGHKTIRKQRHT